MDDELKRLETELAKVRLAKEKLELQRSMRQELQREKLSNAADRVIGASREAADNSLKTIARNTRRTPIAWSQVAMAYAVAAVLFIIWVAGMPESQNNALAFFLIGSCAFAIYGSYLLLRKFLQLALH